ncbi:MAG: 30S ribosome-binding factor RbfA [Clostridia bacterium]|nr:30S ribosome-binding factor RbfA [Clostridia bacterium]
MAKYRRGRINDAVSRELAVILRELRDPRLSDNFVSITRAEVSADLKVARVYFSVMGDASAAKKALEGAEGKLRHHLAITLNLRITPELLFYEDGSIEHGARIAKLLSDIKAEEAERDAEGGEEENHD